MDEISAEPSHTPQTTANNPKTVRRFVGTKKKSANPQNEDLLRTDPNTQALQPVEETTRPTRSLNQVPNEILENPTLKKRMQVLPSNYNFEIEKSIWRIQQANAKHVALQFPEGLMMYACSIGDIIQEFTGAETLILGDVTYGACCIDDFTARAMGADFLIHYGHSCLVPIQATSGITILYVFVDIQVDVQHFVDTIKMNFDSNSKLAFVSTIQFSTSLQAAKKSLQETHPYIFTPQSKPLSAGEILGCTSPKVSSADAIVYLGDGRFHLESIMISNAAIPAYRYDPYAKEFTIEKYATEEMHVARKKAIEKASSARHFGIILGTLGRQGSPNLLKRIQDRLAKAGKTFMVVLLSEIFPHKLALFPDIDAWIQIACPRLSIDWGEGFSKPLLTTYEAEVALKVVEWQKDYPMDFYSKDGGSWTVNYQPPRT
eukprot:TRINITY_DN6918_c0_g1_i1.p1 TRINITY_DN6918_c0_g1~~TRINITY_DN6918_c0_g1_i1.p1  ORF type:complete len:431 (-),score=109.41 TRINITY_DN6918_c0_g1_i1:82-1374(-)